RRRPRRTGGRRASAAASSPWSAPAGVEAGHSAPVRRYGRRSVTARVLFTSPHPPPRRRAGRSDHRPHGPGITRTPHLVPARNSVLSFWWEEAVMGPCDPIPNTHHDHTQSTLPPGRPPRPRAARVRRGLGGP